MQCNLFYTQIHVYIFIIHLFIQPSYGNTFTDLSLLAFLHYIVLNTCTFSSVYTLNLKWLVYINSNKKHEIKTLVAQWLTYLFKCFPHISDSYLIATRRRSKMQLKSISAKIGMWTPLFQDNILWFILKKIKRDMKKSKSLHIRMVRCPTVFLH